MRMTIAPALPWSSSACSPWAAAGTSARVRNPVNSSRTTARLMFPDLAPQLQNAARVEISHQDKTTTIAKHGDTWGSADRGGYVVQPSKLRGMLTALTELRLVEPRTTDPGAVQSPRP